MISKYENRMHIKMPLKYRGITNITRKGDVFTVDSLIWKPKDLDYKTAVRVLAGYYYHFLIWGGHISTDLSAAYDPTLIFLNLTENGKPGGEPVLSKEETTEYLGLLLHGLYCFHNRKCRNTDIMQGMAYFIRKLYEPYMNSGDSDIPEMYYAIIARGSFVLQMSNKLLAKAFYKGLYESWPYAKERKRYFLGGQLSLDSMASYDSILDHDEISYDPMHDEKKYPWNMYKYNVDNIILTYCAAKEMKEIGNKKKCFPDDKLRKYGQTMDFIYDFFTSVSALYKVRCDFFNERKNPRIKDGDPITYYSNINTTLNKYLTLEMDYCPYLFYSCELFRSTDKPETWLYTGIAKNYTGRDYDRYDKDCAIFGERIRRQGSFNNGIAVGINSFMDAAVLLSFAVLVIRGLYEWQMRTHGFTIMFWIMVAVIFFGGGGSGSRS